MTEKYIYVHPRKNKTVYRFEIRRNNKKVYGRYYNELSKAIKDRDDYLKYVLGV